MVLGHHQNNLQQFLEWSPLLLLCNHGNIGCQVSKVQKGDRILVNILKGNYFILWIEKSPKNKKSDSVSENKVFQKLLKSQRKIHIFEWKTNDRYSNGSLF